MAIFLRGTNGSGNLVVCRVVMFHVDEKVYNDEKIDPQAIDLVGRNSGNFYTRASGKAIFEVHKPATIGIGIDALPTYILKSEFIKRYQLARLGSLESLPVESEIREFIQVIHAIEKESIPPNSPEKEFISVLKRAYAVISEDQKKAQNMIECSAYLAIEKQDISFAIKALLDTNYDKVVVNSLTIDFMLQL